MEYGSLTKYSFSKNYKRKVSVSKILAKYKTEKEFIVYQDIRKGLYFKGEPDIVHIKEQNQLREAQVFVEIKNTSENDRWIGLTEEQFNTIKRSAGDKEIYMIYASLRSETIHNNPKTTDLTGMFLKEIEDKNKSEIFQKFASLNAECKIEFIISSKDLSQFSFPFERGMNMYETNLFEEKKRSSFYPKDGVRKDVLKIDEYKDFEDTMRLTIEVNLYPEKEEISIFKVKGSFKLIQKKKKTYIECLSDVYLENDIFGFFNLKSGKFYSFNLATVGRDPKLKRNNIFIAKNRVYQLVETGKIRKPERVVEEIVRNI